MADSFKTFDKAPIVGVVNIRQWSFAWREIILAGVALILFVLCLVLAGLYGHAEGELSDQQANPSAVVGQNYCVNQSCLETASRTLHFMNMSVDPCEDFFHYACGNYKNVKTASYGEGTRTVIRDIYLNNEDKLTDILEKPVDRVEDWSAERKLKEFFQSCTDTYTREKLLGTPFLEKVVPALGGWDLLGTWNEAEWDFNTALKKVQSDFWTDALYGPSVEVDWYDWKRYGIELRPAGTGKFMIPNWYHNPDTQKYRDDYQKFIRRVGSLLMRDAKVTSDPDVQATKLEQFVNDTFTMEKNIAHLSENSDYSYDPYEDVNKVTLNQLNTQTNNVINWVDQLSYLLNGATITGSTKIALKYRDYFKNMTTMITNLPDADRKRMLHNYLIWRVAEVYVQEMSWEYIHANREIYVDIYGTPRFSGVYRYCFAQMGTYMPDALGALFIADHFVDANRKQVKDITEHLKTVLQDQLDKTPWMDAQTRKYAKEKLEATTFKMGYPDWMANHESVDSLYNSLRVNVSDFFGNMLSGNNFFRTLWSREFMRGEDRQKWSVEIYGSTLAVFWYWNEIIAPAGILQNPIYDYTQPHYKTFGSLGGILGRYLHHVVDDYGKHYNKDGDYMDGATWWTNKSLNSYAPVRQCVADAYRNATNDVTYPDGQQRYIAINPVSYAPRAIATINGVRLALNGYRKWVKERAMAEKMLPGLDLTDEQMVFLSYAQDACYDRDFYWSLLYAFQGRLEEDLQINIAMSQLPEFSQAFKCKKTAKMNAAKKCDYY